MHKSFIPFSGFKFFQKIPFFPIVKTVPKYAKIARVGSFDEVFNKFHLFKIPEIFTVWLWDNNNLIII